MKVLKITALTIMYVVLGVLLLFNLYNVFNKLIGNPLPDYFGYSFLCMSGNDTSMHINGGELVVVDRVEPDTIEVGDVIVFDFDDEIAISTVMYTLDGSASLGEDAGGGFVTKNEESDEPNAAPSYDDVYGKVIATYPNFGNLYGFLTSWQFNILLLTVYIVIVWSNIIILSSKIKVQEEREERRRAYQKYLEENNIIEEING
ncbi:MAG: hypothetical protein IJZ29_05535 [Clostridia bacterium]|nr:hypothetical protein [Clostridia bacterium]